LRAAAANLRGLTDELRARPAALLGLRSPRDRKPGDPAPKKEGGQQ
jgi:hypothetical protein